MKVKVTARSYTLLQDSVLLWQQVKKERKIKLCKHMNHVSLSPLGAAV